MIRHFARLFGIILAGGACLAQDLAEREVDQDRYASGT
jgi:hypothetical protein